MLGDDLARPYCGVRLGGAPFETVLERCVAYAARMADGQAFSHHTAAALWGMPLPHWMQTDPAIHVSTFDDSNRPRLRGVIGHQLSDPALRLVTRGGLRVLDPATVWLQLAASVEFTDLVGAGDYLVLTPRRPDELDARPYISLEKLRERTTRFRGRGRRLALSASGSVCDGAESPKETALRLALLHHGLPVPLVNPPVHDAGGAVIGYGDLVYPDHRVIVEYDGEHHRTDSRQFYRDVERHEALTRAGYVVLRQTKETPAIGPRSIQARAEAALRSRGWSAPRTPHRESPKSGQKRGN